MSAWRRRYYGGAVDRTLSFRSDEVAELALAGTVVARPRVGARAAKGNGCKPVGFAYEGSNPSRPTMDERPGVSTPGRLPF